MKSDYPYDSYFISKLLSALLFLSVTNPFGVSTSRQPSIVPCQPQMKNTVLSFVTFSPTIFSRVDISPPFDCKKLSTLPLFPFQVLLNHSSGLLIVALYLKFHLSLPLSRLSSSNRVNSSL